MTKHNRGITLISLVVTVIILIILATVTINLILKSKIINFAQSATQNYTLSQIKEQDELEELIINIDEIIDTLEQDTNTTWKKEHKVRVRGKGNIKYQWTDTTAEPDVDTFINTVENGDVVVENTLTGQYYLWTLIEGANGQKKIKRSDVFYFDNTAPTGELNTEWIKENEQDKLKIDVTNANDEHSGLNNNSAKIFVTPENGTREEKKIVLNNGEGSVILDVDREGVTKVELIITDNAGNKFEKEANVGRVYFLKNSIPIKTVTRKIATR